MIPPALKTRNLDHPDLDPLYAAAVELDMPLGVHGAPGIHLPKIGVDRFDNYIQVHCVSFPFDQMTAMTALVSGGVFDRHPKLRVAFLEAGVGWVPYFIDRMHEHYEKRGDWIPNGWRRDPREYVEAGNIWVSCEPEEPILPAVVEHPRPRLHHVRQRLPALGRRLAGEHQAAARAPRHQRGRCAPRSPARTRGASTACGVSGHDAGPVRGAAHRKHDTAHPIGSRSRAPIGPRKSQPRERRVAVNGIELTIFEWHAASARRGDPILLAHATGFHARCWDRVVAHLGTRYVVAVDQRGPRAQRQDVPGALGGLRP